MKFTKWEKNRLFFHFEKLQSEFDKAIEEIKDRKYGQKITFFANERNAKIYQLEISSYLEILSYKIWRY